MKRRYIFILSICFILIGFILIITNQINNYKIQKNIQRTESLVEGSKVEKQEKIAKSLIRFHVLANSDSSIDQDVKLKVKERVLKEITPSLKKSQNLKETRTIIENNQERIMDISKEVLKENGKNYGVRTTLGSFSFPAKHYGNFSLPPGDYEAFRIVLGEGKGSNWWCVMFPPLCFINIERGDHLEEEEGKDLTQLNNNQENLDSPQPIEIRWKFIDLLESIFNKKTNPNKS